jgi:hypothetical protein
MNRIRSVERCNGYVASVLWDARGNMFIDNLEKGQTINSEYYMGLLERLNQGSPRMTFSLSKPWKNVSNFIQNLIFCLATIIARKNSHTLGTVSLNDEIKKKRLHLKKKSAVSSRKCTVSQINQNDGKIAWIRLLIASPSTVFSRSGPERLFSVCRPQKNACWK